MWSTYETLYKGPTNINENGCQPWWWSVYTRYPDNTHFYSALLGHSEVRRCIIICYSWMNDNVTSSLKGLKTIILQLQPIRASMWNSFTPRFFLHIFHWIVWYLQCYSLSCWLLSYWPFPKNCQLEHPPEAIPAGSSHWQPMDTFLFHKNCTSWNHGTARNCKAGSFVNSC